jgi:hypothetical protein
LKNTKINQLGAVTTVNFDDVKSGWKKWLLLQSDIHWDSKYCNRKVLTKQLDEALKRNALIFMFGDIYDAMNGRYDNRKSYDEIRPEFCYDNYYDLIVDESTKYYSKYSANICLISRGNHEMSVIKYANTDLIDRLVSGLNIKNESNIVRGGYGGWVKFLFKINRTKGFSLNLKYFHGAGGEAPVTRGIIWTNRQAVYLPDANFVVNGHNHHQYHVSISRERITDRGNIYFDIQHHIRIPGFKQSYGDGSTGWDVTRGGVPKPIGSVWCRLYKVEDHIEAQIIPDVTGADPIEVKNGYEYSNESRYFDDEMNEPSQD